jgi:hypothetical protein
MRIRRGRWCCGRVFDWPSFRRCSICRRGSGRCCCWWKCWTGSGRGGRGAGDDRGGGEQRAAAGGGHDGRTAGRGATGRVDGGAGAVARAVRGGVERYDVEGLVALLREDSTFSMPPYSLWLQGPARCGIGCWGTGQGAGARGYCGGGVRVAAFAQYRVAEGGGHRPWALVVLELDGDRIAGWNSFLDTETLFPLFGLPDFLPADR